MFRSIQFLFGWFLHCIFLYLFTNVLSYCALLLSGPAQLAKRCDWSYQLLPCCMLLVLHQVCCIWMSFCFIDCFPAFFVSFLAGDFCFRSIMFCLIWISFSSFSIYVFKSVLQSIVKQFLIFILCSRMFIVFASELFLINISFFYQIINFSS